MTFYFLILRHDRYIALQVKSEMGSSNHSFIIAKDIQILSPILVRTHTHMYGNLCEIHIPHTYTHTICYQSNTFQPNKTCSQTTSINLHAKLFGKKQSRTLEVWETLATPCEPDLPRPHILATIPHSFLNQSTKKRLHKEISSSINTWMKLCTQTLQ